MTNKTHSPSVKDIARKWHLLDAKGQVLGRFATQIAKLLMGKDKPDFVRHLDMADHVVVTNAKEVVVTGNKFSQKLYHRHSGHPGGMTVTPYFREQQNHPDRIIIKAVSGMLPRNKLHDRLLSHLHVYPDANHPYTKQFKSQ
jgi:large subunit ribosomal protein L13